MNLANTDDANSTDEALMQRFASGDAHAFETLYDRHERAVWRFILRSVRDNAIADDICQDVWFAIARSASTFTPTAKFRTWAFTMARNRMIDLARGKKKMLSLDEADDDSAPSPFANLAADSRLGPLRQLESKDSARELLNAVEQLPSDQREAFLLQAEGEMSVEEIAIATNVSFETAKSRLRYARNKLKSLLTPASAVTTALSAEALP